MEIVFLLFFAILPSLLWLFYWLKKDDYPEPKKLIAVVFFSGAFFAVITYFFQSFGASLFFDIGKSFPLLVPLLPFFYTFILVALIEEISKYIAFYFTISENKELDEPIDFVIYMITAGLGFAALENLLIISSYEEIGQIATVSLVRFISGTLLHALVSGILGIFLAYACRLEKKTIILAGIIFVSFLHGSYNYLSDIAITKNNFLPPLIFLFFLVFLLLFLISKIKKMKSVCLLK